MATGRAAKADRRAHMYRARIAVCNRDGDYKGAFDQAVRWLLEELVKAARQRPHHAAGTYRALTAKVVQLAEQVPDFKPPDGAP